jgi:hypothetical protein
MTYPVCPCDADVVPAPVNLPGLGAISYRVGTYASFRQAVLTPLFVPATPLPVSAEQSLSVAGKPVWTTDGAGDLAVMIAEWFAYVGDIIAFYNERIANQDYLRTASLPESVNNLIALLGYRPRPAIGAFGMLAALLSPGPGFGADVLLPQGLQFQSKPVPGQPPQIFELQASTPTGTPIAAPDQLPAAPAPVLLDGGGGLLLQGAVSGIAVGTYLLLSATDGSGGPWLGAVTGVTVGPAPAGGQQTALAMNWTVTPGALNAAAATLASARQSSGLWSFYAGYDPINSTGTLVQLAGLARQINPGDWLLFTSTGGGTATAALAQVASTQDLLWDANATGPGSPPFQTVSTPASGSTPATTTTPLPLPHTQLTLTAATALSGWSAATGVTVQFGFVPVGTLLNQPAGVWAGTPTVLVGTGGQNFPVWGGASILLQDSTGVGIPATAKSGGNNQVTLSGLPDPVPPLQPPFLVLPNLLEVNCGKTIANEVLGSGDATNPAQDFKLSQSPVTYLTQGASYASTIQLTVNNLPWTEVASFYGQAADATVFVTREDNQGSTHVMFGDGVNGARLPTGVNNVVATYRIGAGSASPPAGKLSVIAKSWPGLRAVLNPVAVTGGTDADRSDQIQRDAPRSVLAFKRAVSVFDYQALADQVPTVTRSRAVWGWNDAQQRTQVTLYVGDDAAAAQAAQTSLGLVGDPNRPVSIVAATQIAVTLNLTLYVTPGMDTTIIGNGITAALTDEETGLFGAWNLAIGETLFDSQIEAAVLGVQGVVAIIASTFRANGVAETKALHFPGEGGFYTLAPADLTPLMEPDPNG